MSGPLVPHETLRSFASRAVANPGDRTDYLIGQVIMNAPDHIIGFMRVVNAQEVRKNLSKHGNATKLINNQPPIEAKDFDAIRPIIVSGTYRVIGTKGASKPQRIEYRARVKGRDYVYLETVGFARRRVALLSFYRVR